MVALEVKEEEKLKCTYHEERNAIVKVVDVPKEEECCLCRDCAKTIVSALCLKLSASLARKEKEGYYVA